MFETSQKSQSRWKGFWPDVDDLDTAKAASRQGMWAALFVAGVTALAAAFGVLGMDAWAFLDAALFGLVALGLYRQSRTAAVFGLLLFVIERVAMFAQTQSSGGILAIVLLLAFGNGARGAFAYQKLRKEAQAAKAPVA